MYCTLLVNKKKYSFFKGDFLVALVCVYLLGSCSSGEEVARVNDHILYRSEAAITMKNLGYDTKKPEDWKIFVDSWVKAKIMVDQLSAEEPKKAIVSNHRSALFEGELAEYYLTERRLREKVDTSIGDQQLQQYYQSHLEEFTLQDFIVKALFLKVPLEAPVINQIKSAYLLKNDKDLAQIESYAKLYAEDFYFDDENWVFFNQIGKKIPIKSLNKENLVLNRTKTYLSDDKFVYFINVLDFKLKDENPPFEFVRETIRERVIAARLNEQRTLINNTLNQQLKSKHEVKINL